MDALIITIALVSITITSLYWGALLSIKLPEFDSRFDRKPFNCRPCFTFHFTWILSALAALIGGYGWLLPYGVVLAFVLFLIVKHIDNKKITK